jgi:hypothetical protein
MSRGGAGPAAACAQTVLSDTFVPGVDKPVYTHSCSFAANEHREREPNAVKGRNHLASAPELENVTGQYFASSTPKKSSKRSYSQSDIDRLWQVSSALVGLESDSERSTNLP